MAFVFMIGLMPTTFVSASRSNDPDVDIAVSCRVLSIELDDFEDERDAEEAEGYTETLWVKNIATFQWSVNKPSGSGWSKAVPNQTRWVETSPAVSAASNYVKVTIDGIVVADDAFGEDYDGSWNFVNEKVAHSYIIEISPWNDDNTIVRSGESTPCGEEEKVSICHRSNSATNPYQFITVSRSAVDGIAGNSGQTPDHYGEHQGPIASSEAVANQLKDDKIEWGDIIPPVSGAHSGYNYTVVGQAMLANGCNFAKVATASVSTTPATCQAAETLVYGAITNAVFSGTANGTTGPVAYSVTATANADSLFDNQNATKQFSGTLAGMLTGEQCLTPATPAAVTFVDPTCEADGSYTIPETEGVDYQINGQTQAAGAYTAVDGDSVTITAVAQSGYILNGTTSWSHEFYLDEECREGVEVTPVVFFDPTCGFSGSYTIPATTGVLYTINDVVVEAGTYQVSDGDSVTIVPIAQKGYYLIGEPNSFSWDFSLKGGCTDITYGVECSSKGAVVTLINNGDADGQVDVNGETVAVAAGETVTRTYDTTDEGLKMAISIGEETVYEKVVTCDTGDVLGDTPTVLPNTAGTSPLAFITAFISTASVIGLASIIARKALVRY